METQEMTGLIFVYSVVVCSFAAVLFRRKCETNVGCRKAGPFRPGAYDNMTDSMAVTAVARLPGL